MLKLPTEPFMKNISNRAQKLVLDWFKIRGGELLLSCQELHELSLINYRYVFDHSFSTLSLTL